MKKISLSRDLFALVDDCDYEDLCRFSWQAVPASNSFGGFYARRNGGDGEPTVVYMHRQIMRAPKGLDVDHKSCDGLDNQRSNLRLCSKSQNSANVRVKGNKTGFRGVHREIQKSGETRYQGVVWAQRKRYRTPWFKTAEEAGAARDSLAKDIHGEFFRSQSWRCAS